MGIYQRKGKLDIQSKEVLRIKVENRESLKIIDTVNERKIEWIEDYSHSFAR